MSAAVMNVLYKSHIISPTTYFQPYFCGQDLECTKHNSRWALLRAMESVDRHYPVVGVLEELDRSLMVMQSLMPRFFGGIRDLFGNGNASELETKGEYKLKSQAKVLERGVYARRLLQAGFNLLLTPIELAGVNDWLKPAWSRRLV